MKIQERRMKYRRNFVKNIRGWKIKTGRQNKRKKQRKRKERQKDAKKTRRNNFQQWVHLGAGLKGHHVTDVSDSLDSLAYVIGFCARWKRWRGSGKRSKSRNPPCGKPRVWRRGVPHRQNLRTWLSSANSNLELWFLAFSGHFKLPWIPHHIRFIRRVSRHAAIH